MLIKFRFLSLYYVSPLKSRNDLGISPRPSPEVRSPHFNRHCYWNTGARTTGCNPWCNCFGCSHDVACGPGKRLAAYMYSRHCSAVTGARNRSRSITMSTCRCHVNTRPPFFVHSFADAKDDQGGDSNHAKNTASGAANDSEEKQKRCSN